MADLTLDTKDFFNSHTLLTSVNGNLTKSGTSVTHAAVGTASNSYARICMVNVNSEGHVGGTTVTTTTESIYDASAAGTVKVNTSICTKTSCTFIMVMKNVFYLNLKVTLTQALTALTKYSLITSINIPTISTLETSSGVPTRYANLLVVDRYNNAKAHTLIQDSASSSAISICPETGIVSGHPLLITGYVYHKKVDWSVNLNSQWVSVTSDKAPDYFGFTEYKSNSNYNVASGIASMSITIPSGRSEFYFYLNSYGENNFDYAIAWDLDTTPPSSPSYTSTGVHAHTRGKSADPSGALDTNWTKVEYPNDGKSHTIWITYRKDGSVNNYDDRAYVLIPNAYV